MRAEVSVVYTAPEPFLPPPPASSSADALALARHAAVRDERATATKMFVNLRGDGDDVPFRLAYFLQPVTKRLCRGEAVRGNKVTILLIIGSLPPLFVAR